MTTAVSHTLNFYPRPPRGGRPLQAGLFIAHDHISIHALREEGDRTRGCLPTPQRISIHALREEGDQEIYAQGTEVDEISIHALREEGDRMMFSSLVSSR